MKAIWEVIVLTDTGISVLINAFGTKAEAKEEAICKVLSVGRFIRFMSMKKVMSGSTL